MDEEDLGEHVLGDQGNQETDPLKREIGESLTGVQVLSLASKSAKGLLLMEAMGFKDKGSFSKQIGRI